MTSSSLSSSRMWAWSAWAVASIFYAYQYILRVMPSIMLSDIMEQFQMSAGTFGQFSGIYYLGYSLIHIPVGILLDRLGPKKVMTACSLLTVLGLMPLLFTEFWLYPLIGRLFVGLGSSGAILGVFKILRMTFSEKRFARMLSLSVTIGLIGAIYGGGPVSYLCTRMGFKGAVCLFAALGLVLSFITYLALPDQRENTSQKGVLSDAAEVLSNPKVLLSCIFAGVMVGPLEGFADVWAATFLSRVYGYETSFAASLPSLIFVGMCFGAPVLTFIADRIKSYLAVIVGSGFLMAVGFTAFLTTELSTQVLSLSFVVIGVCCAYQILAIYKASTYVRPQLAGQATALANMIIMFFGYGFHAAIGFAVKHFGGASNPESLTYGIWIIPAALAVGALGFTGLWAAELRGEKNVQLRSS